ncbi:hypothetical protein ACROYT_G041417 [Oculina patagonica]
MEFFSFITKIQANNVKGRTFFNSNVKLTYTATSCMDLKRGGQARTKKVEATFIKTCLRTILYVGYVGQIQSATMICGKNRTRRLEKLEFRRTFMEAGMVQKD